MVMLAPEQARLARAFYDAFTDMGFDEAQAIYLVAVEITQHPGKA